MSLAIKAINDRINDYRAMTEKFRQDAQNLEGPYKRAIKAYEEMKAKNDVAIAELGNAAMALNLSLTAPLLTEASSLKTQSLQVPESVELSPVELSQPQQVQQEPIAASVTPSPDQ